MRVTVLELATSWGEPQRVLAEIGSRLEQGGATDLVVVPEAALHGYVSADGDFDLSRFAEPIDGPAARGCAALAVAHGVHLIASLVLREGDALYNAMTCFAPSGELAFVYRKRHPWMPETWATPGPLPPPVVDIHGHAVTIAVCYDVHFLQRDAARELEAADVLVFPSAWVERPDTRTERLQRLAQRFGVHVINANWAAGVVHVPGQHGSCVIGPDGSLIARAPPAGRIDATL